MARRGSHPAIEPAKPVKPTARRKRYLLDVERIHPFVRIAHELSTSIGLVERTIIDHEIVLLLEGEADVRMGEETADLGAMGLVLFQPFVPHSIVTRPGIPARHIAVHFDFASDLPPVDTPAVHRRAFVVALSQAMALPKLQ